MLQSYEMSIEYDALRPPRGMPTGLVYLFIEGIPYQKFSIARPMQTGSKPFFNIGILAPAGLEIVAYIQGEKYPFVMVDSLEGVGTFCHGSHHIGFAELRQDMKADGFKAIDFPELEEWIGN